MINQRAPLSFQPAAPANRDLAIVSAAAPHTSIGSASMSVAGESPAPDPASVPVQPPQSQRRRGQRRRGRGQQITILVVDDEQPVRETLVEVLSLQGYHVVSAANVEQAEEHKARLGAGGLQLLITDINLLPIPQARAGYALAQRWHAMHPELPIILISGDPGNAYLPEVRHGSLGFLLKPFPMEALLEAVREALGRP